MLSHAERAADNRPESGREPERMNLAAAIRCNEPGRRAWLVGAGRCLTAWPLSSDDVPHDCLAACSSVSSGGGSYSALNMGKQAAPPYGEQQDTRSTFHAVFCACRQGFLSDGNQRRVIPQHHRTEVLLLSLRDSPG